MPMLSIPVAGGSIPVHVPNPKAPDPLHSVLHPKFGFVVMQDARTLKPAELATIKATACQVSLCPVHQFGSLVEFAFKGKEESGLPPLTFQVVHSAVIQRIVERVDASTVLTMGLPVHLLVIDYRAAEVVALREGTLNESMARRWSGHAKRQLRALHLFDVDDYLQDMGRMLDVLRAPLPRHLTTARIHLRMPPCAPAHAEETTSSSDAMRAIADAEG